MSIEAVIFSKKFLYHWAKNKEGGSSRDSLFYFSYFYPMMIEWVFLKLYFMSLLYIYNSARFFWVGWQKYHTYSVINIPQSVDILSKPTLKCDKFATNSLNSSSYPKSVAFLQRLKKTATVTLHNAHTVAHMTHMKLDNISPDLKG